MAKVEASTAMMLSALLFTSSLSAPVVLHVAPPSGTTPQPLSDGSASLPFESVADARDALRAMQPLPDGGATVLLHGGNHLPFALGASDSGTADAPITYAGAIGGVAATVSGGLPVPAAAFKPYSGAAVAGVLKAELAPLGVTAEMLGSMQTAPMTCVGSCQHDKSDLFLGEKAMTLARFPNKAEDGTWRYLQADLAGQFGRGASNPGGTWFLLKAGANATRIQTWGKRDPDAWLHGYWGFDWADCYRKLAKVTPLNVNGTAYINVSFDAITHNPGMEDVKTHARFYGVNLKSELDSPGEYYIDEAELALYFLPPLSSPPSSWSGRNLPTLSVNASSLINATAVQHVSFQNLTVAYGRAVGIEASAVSSMIVRNVTVFGMGTHGVTLSGSDSSVLGSSIHSCGCKGLSTVGGDPHSYTAGNLQIRHNRINNVALWKRTYQAPISFSGCGNVYADNVVSFVPHTCIDGVGTNMTFSGNTLDTCAYESSDVGAFYTCGQGGNAFWNGRGGKIFNNTFKNIRNLDGTGVQGPSVQALYLDDEMSGWEVYENRFINCQAGTFIGGGRDNHFHHNYYENCDLVQHFDNRGMGWQNPSCNCTNGSTCNPAAAWAVVSNPKSAKYVAAFPEVKTAVLAAHGGQHICVPVNNLVEDNRYCKCKKYKDVTDMQIVEWRSVFRNNSEVYDC